MKIRISSFAVLIALLLFSGCATTSPPPVQPATPSIAGTTWRGMDIYLSDLVPYTYTFHPDNLLEYSYQGNTYKNGTWQQAGAAVYMQMNDHYAERLGQISANSMAGKGWNKKGKTWNWQITREQ